MPAGSLVGRQRASLPAPFRVISKTAVAKKRPGIFKIASIAEHPAEAKPMTHDDEIEKVARFQTALNQLIERIAEDRYVLAVVLVGSLSAETIWHRESLGLWVIEADGVSRRLPSDGNDERVF